MNVKSALTCVQLYLEALPEDKGQWINKTNELRARYEKIKETVRAPLCGRFPQHHGEIHTVAGEFQPTT